MRSESTQCANGYVCPSGTRCVTRLDDSNLCVSPDDLAACNGKVEGESCGAGRRCYAIAEGLVCNDAICGNGFVDVASADFPIDEQCDDGNTTAGDGCAADCTSTERCGNGVVDVSNAETCDDGNLLSQDGCSSSCSGELRVCSSIATTRARCRWVRTRRAARSTRRNRRPARA